MLRIKNYQWYQYDNRNYSAIPEKKFAARVLQVGYMRDHHHS